MMPVQPPTRCFQLEGAPVSSQPHRLTTGEGEEAWQDQVHLYRMRAGHQHDARERIIAQNLGGQRGQTMRAAPEIRAAHCQPKTCWEDICQRRATSETRVPDARVSAMIRACSSIDQRSRRAGRVNGSMHR